MLVATCKNCGGDLVIDESSGWWTHINGLPLGVKKCVPKPRVDECFGLIIWRQNSSESESNT